ncbi:MAG: hypothetical protein AAGI48_05120 [Verrucomicrobiota bacterium]
MAMKSFGVLILAAIALITLVIPAKSEIVLTFSTGRAYTQSGRFTMSFDGGDLFVALRDGNYITAACADAPSQTIIAPNLLCPLGTTAFVAFGDFDGDGVRDDLSYDSVSQVIAAILVEPFRPDLCELVSAPPSKLPRPLGPFVDRGAILFFNVLTNTVLQFNITIYEFARNYPEGPGGLGLMNDEVVLGSYIFSFPTLGNPDLPVPIAVTYSSIPEGFNPAARYPETLFRFTSGVFDENGFYLMDNRLTSIITWVGNDVTNSSPVTDIWRLQIVNPNADDPADFVIFPPNGDETTGDLVLPDPFVQEYILPPLLSGFEAGTVFGETAEFRLRFSRVRATSAIAFDTSRRFFTFAIRFVDSYEGFRLAAFPTGQSANATSANADFDDDDWSNIEEYGLQTDPNDPTSFPADPVAEVIDGRVVFSMVKRPNGTARYQFEVSTNGGPFRLVRTNDPVWEIFVDDETDYVIRTRVAADPAAFAARPRISQIPIQ